MTLAANPPIELPLEQLTADQKWQVFQFLWKEIIEDHPEKIEPPAWHEDILREREEKEARGESVWRDIDEAFADIRRRVS